MRVSWGVLSTARINEPILRAAGDSDDAEVVAVASRSRRRAKRYARKRGIPRAHGSYEELLADDAVEAVYVSLPNGLHAEWALRALGAGKHVLVEKPFASRVHEVERCFDAAEERGLVLSEAFMWRHHPQADALARLVREGAVGRLRAIDAQFAFELAAGDDPRWDPALDGGALMDIGCYCVSAARLLAGEPEHVEGIAEPAPSGVDLRFAGKLRFPSDVMATFACGFDGPPVSRLEVAGDEGRLVVGDPFHSWEPGIELRRNGSVERIDVARVDQYRLQLEDVSAAIRDGREPRLGRADAVGQARVIEALLHG